MAFIEHLRDLQNEQSMSKEEIEENMRQERLSADIISTHQAIRDKCEKYAKDYKASQYSGWITAFEDYLYENNYLRFKRRIQVLDENSKGKPYIGKRPYADKSGMTACIGDSDYCLSLTNAVSSRLKEDGFQIFKIETTPVYRTYFEKVHHLFAPDETVRKETNELFGYILKIHIEW